MTLGQFINELFNNIKDPYNTQLRIGQVVMDTICARNPKLYKFICQETNYDCYYDNEMVASTMAFVCDHPEYWEQ